MAGEEKKQSSIGTKMPEVLRREASLMIDRCSRWGWLSWRSPQSLQFQLRRAASRECMRALKSDSVFIRVLITGEVGIRPGNMTREADIRVIKLERLPLKSNQIMLLLSSLTLSILKGVGK